MNAPDQSKLEELRDELRRFRTIILSTADAEQYLAYLEATPPKGQAEAVAWEPGGTVAFTSNGAVYTPPSDALASPSPSKAPVAAPWRTAMAEDRVDFKDDGTLDEVVATRGAHLECMGGKRWFLLFCHEDGTETAFWFDSKDLRRPFYEKRQPRSLPSPHNLEKGDRDG